MMLKLSVLLYLLPAVTGTRFCFDKTGCFELFSPFSGTPQRSFPLIPKDVPIQCHLFTRNSQEEPKDLCSDDPSAISSSGFHPGSKTYIIIHGYSQSSREPWMKRMAEAILTAEPANCILVDWSSGSLDPVMSVIQTIRFVGMKVANMINRLQETHSYDADGITVIGHSLGAQIAGYIGKSVDNLGRITGLDPAGLMFEGENESARLCRSDAKIVQCFHTDATPLAQMGVGYIQPLGSNDVYVNGGSNMPECPAPDMSPQEQACTLALMMGPLTCADTGFPTPEQCAKILANFTFTPVSIRAAFCKIFCNHFMAIPYYIGSILHREKYVGRPCESVEKCRKGETLPCPSGGCPQLGHYARFPPGDTGGPHLYHLKAWEEPLLP